jgi:hypothetical protein
MIAVSARTVNKTSNRSLTSNDRESRTHAAASFCPSPLHLGFLIWLCAPPFFAYRSAASERSGGCPAYTGRSRDSPWSTTVRGYGQGSLTA